MLFFSCLIKNNNILYIEIGDNMEFKELRKLNNLEKIHMIKEYIGIYLVLILKDDREKQKKLLKNLKKYLNTIKIENEIYKFLESNEDKINDPNELDKLLDQIDLTHEKTYKYYDKILLNCEENYDREYDIIPYQDFNTIGENDSITNRIQGLIITLDDIKAFYNDEQVEVLIEKLKIIDEDEKKAIPFFGAFPIEKDGKLIDIKICVPKIKKLKTALINVHELKHGLDLLPQLGKEYKEIDYEQRAREKEKQFIKEYLSKKR